MTLTMTDEPFAGSEQLLLFVQVVFIYEFSVFDALSCIVRDSRCSLAACPPRLARGVRAACGTTLQWGTIC